MDLLFFDTVTVLLVPVLLLFIKNNIDNNLFPVPKKRCASEEEI